MGRANEVLAGVEVEYVDHNRRAASRLYKINSTKKTRVWVSEYRDLIKITELTRGYATGAV